MAAFKDDAFSSNAFASTAFSIGSGGGGPPSIPPGQAKKVNRDVKLTVALPIVIKSELSE